MPRSGAMVVPGMLINSAESRTSAQKKRVYVTSLPLSPVSCNIYTAVLCKMCRGVFYYYFLVIYLPKIAQHLFCGELPSQSFTVALTEAKRGHGPYSVILKPFVSTT